MEERLAEFLRRLGEAEGRLKRAGEERRPFLLIYASGGSVGIKHPGWDQSWMRPTAEDVDDLEELGFARNEPAKNTKRVFTLTVRGRQQADALAARAPKSSGGRAPSLDETLRWLASLEQDSPEALNNPGDLPSRAATSGLIAPGSEEILAQRIIDLMSQGFLAGDAPEFDQAGPMQRLQLSDGVRLTMRTHERLEGGEQAASSLNFYGSVIAGQIASGDINNFVSFGDLLEKAEEEITGLEDVDPSDRDSALDLIGVLRGKAAGAGAQVLTGAGGGLLAEVLARLIGLPPLS
jgi:hypothetical protein